MNERIELTLCSETLKEIPGSKRKREGEQLIQMRKKRFFEQHAGGSEDEDDEEPFVKQWNLRDTTVPTEEMLKIKLEK